MQRISGEALELLPILEHVSYITEAMLIDALGDARYEINRLVEKIRERRDLNLDMAIEKLVAAEKLMGEGNVRHASGHLSSVTRGLWNRVLV